MSGAAARSVERGLLAILALVAAGNAAYFFPATVDDNLWMCSAWAPALGSIRVRGQVRAVGVEGAANERQGAVESLRLEAADGTQDYPTIRAWSGTTAWTAFAVGWPADAGVKRYRACVGRNGASGQAWFDDVHAGSADR
jgi:hypothetical protein